MDHTLCSHWTGSEWLHLPLTHGVCVKLAGVDCRLTICALLQDPCYSLSTVAWSPLYAAAFKGHTAVARLLVEAGASVAAARACAAQVRSEGGGKE